MLPPDHLITSSASDGGPAHITRFVRLSQRRPVCYANQALRQIESLIIAAKREQVSLGARKIRELLVRRLMAPPVSSSVRVPSKMGGKVCRSSSRRSGNRHLCVMRLMTVASDETCLSPNSFKSRD
jgi:hypothetical protein